LGQRALSQDSLMRSNQGNFHIFGKRKQLILIDKSVQDLAFCLLISLLFD